ncbi:hypothetical protein [Mesorhizobium sp. WSM1293]|nr:hypothetical protein [Mesorhizobium sp. WSM1293]
MICAHANARMTERTPEQKNAISGGEDHKGPADCFGTELIDGPRQAGA